MTDDRKCDSPNGGVIGIRVMRQSKEMCDYEGGVRRCGKV